MSIHTSPSTSSATYTSSSTTSAPTSEKSLLECYSELLDQSTTPIPASLSTNDLHIINDICLKACRYVQIGHIEKGIILYKSLLVNLRTNHNDVNSNDELIGVIESNIQYCESYMKTATTGIRTCHTTDIQATERDIKNRDSDVNVNTDNIKELYVDGIDHSIHSHYPNTVLQAPTVSDVVKQIKHQDYDHEEHKSMDENNNDAAVSSSSWSASVNHPTSLLLASHPAPHLHSENDTTSTSASATPPSASTSTSLDTNDTSPPSSYERHYRHIINEHTRWIRPFKRLDRIVVGKEEKIVEVYVKAKDNKNNMNHDVNHDNDNGRRRNKRLLSELKIDMNGDSSITTPSAHQSSSSSSLSLDHIDSKEQH